MIQQAKNGFTEEDKYQSELFRLFDEYRLQIAGITPMIYNGPDGRPLEIRTWLARRPEVSKFVILDDEDFWNWGWMQPFVVTTTRHRTVGRNGHQIEKRICGLDAEFSQQAIEILNGNSRFYE